MPVYAWLELKLEKDNCYTSAIVIAQLAYWVRSKQGRQKRASSASGILLRCSRATLPAFISRTERSSSAPRSRLASHFFNSLGLNLAIDGLPKPLYQ